MRQRILDKHAYTIKTQIDNLIRDLITKVQLQSQMIETQGEHLARV